MTERLKYSWKLDGFIEGQRCYLSETTIDVNNPPSPVAILTNSDRTHIEEGLTLGKYYYTRISAYKNGVEKFGDEKKVLFGKPWTPIQLGAQLVSHVDSDNVIFDGSGDYVSQLTDVSGNNNNFVRLPASGKNPRIIDGFVSFNGTSDILVGTTQGFKDAFKNTDACSIFSVFKKRVLDTNASIDRVVFSSPASNSKSRLALSFTKPSQLNKLAITAIRLDSDAELTAYSATQDLDLNIIHGCADYINGKELIYKNGSTLVDVANLTTGVSSSTSGTYGITIGGWSVSSTTYAHADIDLKCFLVVRGVLSIENRHKLEGWAAHKYGLTDNLPAGHPYKTLVPVL